MSGVEIALAAVSLAGTAVSAIGSMASGQAAAAAAGQNAAALRQQAAIEQEQGVLAKQQQLRAGQIARGKSLAVMSNAGIDPSVGSPLDLLDQQARTNEFNANEAKFNYDENAWKMSIGAGGEDLAGAAALSKAEGSAVGGLLSGGAKALGTLDFGTSDPGTGDPSGLADLQAPSDLGGIVHVATVQ